MRLAGWLAGTSVSASGMQVAVYCLYLLDPPGAACELSSHLALCCVVCNATNFGRLIRSSVLLGNARVGQFWFVVAWSSFVDTDKW